MRNSLRFRISMFFVGLVISPLIVVAVILGQYSLTVERERALESQQDTVERLADEFDNLFNGIQNSVQLLGQQIQTASPALQKSLLLSALNSDTYRDVYHQAALLDADGQELVRLSRHEIALPGDLVSRSGREEYETAKATGEAYFSSVWFDETSGESLITIAMPLTELGSTVVKNVFVVDTRVSAIEPLIAGHDLGIGEQIYVIDGNGAVVAHHDPSSDVQNLRFEAPEQDGFATGLDGQDVILAVDTFEQVDLTLTAVAEKSEAEALKIANNTLTVFAVVIAVATITAILISIFAARYLVTPIEQLSRVAGEIQKGNFQQIADMNRSDEIGQLASAFNEMTMAIQKRETDLRQQAEALRLATAKAKEAARVKGEFLANVSHELRTPLNAIIGFSDMLLAGMSGPLNDKQQHKMSRLKENGSRLLALINDLLDLTRIEAGRIEMVEKPFSPRELADRLSAQMESLALESNLNFETVVDPDVPELLMGDEKRVEQVVVNLLSNAFKFTEEGSVNLWIVARPEEETWTIVVADTGIGIPPHAVNVIFEEFRQLDGSYSRAYKGSGLGLAITRNLVRTMGGKISVKSEIGSGSAFTVVLPLNIPEATKLPVIEAVAS